MSTYNTPKFQEKYSEKLTTCLLLNATPTQKLQTYQSNLKNNDFQEEKIRVTVYLKRFRYIHKVNSLYTKQVVDNYNTFDIATTLSAFSKVSRNLGGFFMPPRTVYTWW